MMRILQLCYEFPPVGGGAARVVHGLSRELVRCGHEVTVVTMGFGDLPARERVDGIEVVRCTRTRRQQFHCRIWEVGVYLYPALRAARWLLAARRLLAKREFDVIHAHFVLPDGLTGALLSRESGLPLVITAHGSDIPNYEPYRLKAAHFLAAPVWQFVVRRAHAIVSPSMALTELIQKRKPDAEVELIPNGIDPLECDTQSARSKRILVVSRVVERKGIQHLVQAYGECETDFELHIVGDGPYMPELRRLVERRGQGIKLWGWLDKDSPEMAELFSTSAIFVLPSEAENFPVVLLEAMRAGLAVVTTSGTGCAEVVGDAALLVPPGDVVALRDALTRLTSQPDLRRGLAVAARRRALSHYSWQAIADRYRDVYRRVASSSGVAESATGDGVEDHYSHPNERQRAYRMLK